MNVLVKSLDEVYNELVKSRTRGAKDKKPRKKAWVCPDCGPLTTGSGHEMAIQLHREDGEEDLAKLHERELPHARERSLEHVKEFAKWSHTKEAKK